MTLKTMAFVTALGMSLPSLALAHLDDGGDTLRVPRPAVVALYEGPETAPRGEAAEAVCSLELSDALADALALPDRMRDRSAIAAPRLCALQ